MDEANVAEARRSMSKNEFEQEYMANFNVFEGQIFQVETKFIEEYEHEAGCEYFAGLDPGYRDPTAMVVVSYNPRTSVFHIIDEYLENERTTPEHAESIKELVSKWQIDPIFIDSAAAQFASDLAYVHDIATINAKKSVLPGIAFVQGLFQQERIKISPQCTETIAALDQYQWDPRETLLVEKPKHEHSHIPDAMRYALYTFTV